MITQHAARLVTIALLLAALASSPRLEADVVSDFYAGRDVQLLIGYSPGGGYDAYARLLAKYLGEHLPGHPTIVPQNMPGAGSLTLANYLYNVAPKDGSVFGTFARGMAMEPLLGGHGTRFDARNFSWIGSLNHEVSLCVSWHTSGVKTMQDLFQKQLIVGGTGSGSDTDIFPIVMSNLLGAHIKLISGYPGGNDILLAMERGEVDGRCSWSWSTLKSRRPEWLEEGKINLLVQLALAKHPDLPEVPLITEFAHNDDERQALELIFSRQVMGRPYAAPPGIPPERLEALRRAFDATARDPQFRAEAARLELEINAVSGERIDRLIQRIYSASDEVVQLATEAIRKTDRVALGAHR